MQNVRSGKHLLDFTPAFSKPLANPASQPFLLLAVSPDGERLAVGRRDLVGGIMICSARDGSKLVEWNAPASYSLEFSPYGKLLLQVVPAGTGMKCVNVWDSATGKLAWKLPRRKGLDPRCLHP